MRLLETLKQIARINPLPLPSWKLSTNKRIYAIGDVHGRLDLLEILIDKIDADATEFSGEIVELYLGDFIDRGKDSLGVLRALMQPSKQNHQRICLKGNHEEMLIACLDDQNRLQEWKKYGGMETISSFGLDPRLMATTEGRANLHDQLQHFFSHHSDILNFLKNLPCSAAFDDYYFVHAGIRPGFLLSRQNSHDQLWIREEFLSFKQRHPKMIVHGHTPNSEPDVHDHRINIDTGAYATGILTCLVLEDDRFRFL